MPSKKQRKGPHAEHVRQWKAWKRLLSQKADGAGHVPGNGAGALPEPASSGQILYVKGCGSYSEIVTADSHQVDCFSLADIGECYGRALFRVHRSYLVNLGHVETVRTDYVVVGGYRVPVSSAYRAALRRALGIKV